MNIQRLKLLSIPIICLVGFLIYSNTFEVPFAFDDVGYIQGNGAIRDITDLEKMWNVFGTPARFIGTYSFALNYHLSGYDLFGFHLFNLIIHLVASSFVWWFVLQLLSTPRIKDTQYSHHKEIIALLTALLFVSHPIQTQAVTYIAQRFASLATLFYVGSVCFYLKSRSTQNKKKIIYYSLTALFAVFAMFTKQIAITLPLIIVLIEFMFIRRESLSTLFKNKKTWIFLGAVLGLIFIVPSFYSFSVTDILTMKAESSGSHRGDFINWKTYLLTQFRVVMTYIRLLIVPINQNLLYDFTTSKSLLEWKTLACFLTLLSTFIAGILLYRRNRLLSFGIFWFFIALLVESSIIPIRHVIFEHRVYLPSVGYFLFFSIGAFTLFKTPKMYMAVVCSLILIFSIATYRRNIVWQDSVTLWEDVIKKAPEKSRPYMNLGIAHLEKGNFEGAINGFTDAIKKNHVNYAAYNNRGTAWIAMNDWESAFKDFDKSVEINPLYAEGYINRGNYYGKKKQYDKSIADYNKALEIEPDSAEAYINRGNKYAKLNDFTKALEDYNTAVKLKPKFDKAHKNRANVYEKMKKYDLALADYNLAIKINPKLDKAYYGRANTYRKQKMYELATQDYDTALRLNPRYLNAYLQRANIYMLTKQYNRALEDMLRARQLGFPANEDQLNQLRELASKYN